MKVEVGESLVASWLRHVKGCKVVQTNWKASPAWEHHNEVHRIALGIQTCFSDALGHQIFGGIGFDQVLRQAEIDALGIAFTDRMPEFFTVNVAFHEAGLLYGSKVKSGQ
jgi:hypothetical protein